MITTYKKHKTKTHGIKEKDEAEEISLEYH